MYDANGKEITNAYLDACHGTTSEVMWNGKLVNMYHYVLTQEYPYTIGCFMGTPVRVRAQVSVFPTGAIPPTNFDVGNTPYALTPRQSLTSDFERANCRAKGRPAPGSLSRSLETGTRHLLNCYGMSKLMKFESGVPRPVTSS